jgi:phosphoglucosamine mutase
MMDEGTTNVKPGTLRRAMGRLFGTDGVRGRFGRELTTELARDLGRAAVLVLVRAGTGAPVLVIGRDTRASGQALQDALVEGIVGAGGDAVLAGVVPTPAIAFLTTGLAAAAGVVISASHNPPEDNGIKFFGARGFKLSDALEDQIEEEIVAGGSGGHRSGRVHELPADAPSYLDHVVGTADARLDGMRVVVDCANGAATTLAPEALRRLGADVTTIHAEPDGSNINVGCGATVPEVVAEAVVSAGADAGVTLDGDGDRALFADASGGAIDGDQVLAACAISMRDRGTLEGNTVVATVMSNVGFHRAMQEHGIRVVSAPVGDRYVLEAMLEHDVSLGGEQSGHVIFREHATTGDGMITAVRFLSLAAARRVSVAELVSPMRRYPQVLVNVPVADRERLDDAREVWEAVEAAGRALDGAGRVLVRPSGTEPLVRVMVEAETEELARHHADIVARAVNVALGG